MFQNKLLVLCSLLLCLPGVASASHKKHKDKSEDQTKTTPKGPQAVEHPDSKDFMAVAESNWEKLSDPKLKIQPPNSPAEKPFFPLRDLLRGQDQLSIDNILIEKLPERIANQDITWDTQHDKWVLNHNHGQSAVSLSDPISGIKGPQGIVITDGHHDFFLSLYLGAKTIPVNITEDLSSLSPLEFWKTMKERGLVFLDQDAESLAHSPPEMMNIQDNPNRFLATLLALKVKAKMDPGAFGISKIKGAANPDWIKLNDSEPFIELYVAQALKDAGIVYDPKWGTTVPTRTIEKSRAALVQAQESGKYPVLNKILILDSKDTALKAAGGGEPLKAILKREFLIQCGNAFQ